MRLALFEPDIPQNAGTILRLAACLGVGVDRRQEQAQEHRPGHPRNPSPIGGLRLATSFGRRQA